MGNYFHLLKKHGLKMWGTNLLGVLAVEINRPWGANRKSDIAKHKSMAKTT